MDVSTYRRVSRWAYQSEHHQVRCNWNLVEEPVWIAVRRRDNALLGSFPTRMEAIERAEQDLEEPNLTTGHERALLVMENESQGDNPMTDTTPQFNTCKCLSLYAEEARDDGLVIRLHYGCGEIIPKRRRFKPGHDAKLKSRLLWAYRAEVPFVYNVDGAETARDPLAMAKELGWERFMTAAKPKKAKAAKADEVFAGDRGELDSKTLEGFRPARVKDGRWWKDGHIVAETDDEITVRIHGKGGTPKDITLPRSSDKLEVG